MESDVTESLHDKSFAFPASWKSDFVHVIFIVQKEIGSVENSATGSRDTAVDTLNFKLKHVSYNANLKFKSSWIIHTSLRNRLSGDAARAVEVSWVQLSKCYKYEVEDKINLVD